MRKGQVAGQIFIYIMAVIVVGGIALIGYSAIKGIVSKSCDAEKLTFKSDMESLIEKYTSYGSVNNKVITAPCDYDTVCFVDSSKMGTDLTLCTTNNIIKDSIRVGSSDGSSKNIFVISGGKTIGIGYSSLISLPLAQQNNCTCIKQRNKNFYITFNGKGSSAEISPYTPG
jgi:hypothetical protein